MALHPSSPEEGEIESVTVNITETSLTTETATADKEVGSVSVTGGSEPYNYEVTGTNADKFKVEEGKLKLTEALLEANTYKAKVKVTDSKSKEKESEEFSLEVTGA